MKKRYFLNELTSMVSEKTGYSAYNIAEINVAFEEIVNELLLSADEKCDIEIQIMPGIIVSSTFVPEHDKRMPDGSIQRIKDSVRFTAKITDNFRQSRIKLYRQTRELWERVKRRKQK